MNACKCGCKELVDKNYKRGHSRRGRKNTAEHNDAISKANRGSVKSAESIQKCLQTKLERYGNFDHTTETKIKISSTAKKVGVGKWMIGRNVSAETKAKISDKLKGHVTSKETKIKIGDGNRGTNNGMYGKSLKDFMSKEKYDQYLLNLSISKKEWWLNYPDHKKEIWAERLKEQRKHQVFPAKDTSIEIKIKEFIDKLSIKYTQHKYINDIIHSYQCDFFLEDFNIVIECDGDYWHNYPNYRDIDLIRTEELISQKYKVMRLWERDIKNLTLEEFKYKLIDLAEDPKYYTKLKSMHTETK